MLASFDELVLRCADDNSRSHIREAVRCYEAGAYRSAIVATYIAVCFDLIEKMRVLAAADDAEAKARVEELEQLQAIQLKGDPTAVPGLLRFERKLPELFRDKFEFFGAIEFDQIDRLITDRNRCAHPTFLHSEEPFHPSAEFARLHIRNALELVLTQEPKQGKSALKALRAIITSEYFPTDETEIRNRLEASPLKGARDGLVRAFIDEATFGVVSKESPYYAKPAAIKAAEALVAMRPGVAFPRLCANVGKLLNEASNVSVKYGSLIALRSPDVANALVDANKPALRAFIKNPSGMSKASILDRAMKIEWLKPYAIEEIGKLNSDEIKKLTRTPSTEIVERAVQIMLAAKSFDAANKAADDLLAIMRYLTEAQIRSILAAAQAGTADLRGAFGFESILQILAAENPIGKAALQGLLAEYEIDEPKWIDPTSL
jgi:hypothetical protein